MFSFFSFQYRIIFEVQRLDVRMSSRTIESLLLKSQLNARITFLFHIWIQIKLSQQRKILSSNTMQSIQEGLVVTATTSSERDEEKRFHVCISR
jgi:hypothetical protein